MDRTRNVLTGDEVRACWQAPPGEPEPYPGLFRDLAPTQAPSGPVPVIRTGGSVREMIPVLSPVVAEAPRHPGPGPLGVALRREVSRPAAAAAGDPRDGRLVEAPVVPPSHRISSAAERMLRTELVAAPVTASAATALGIAAAAASLEPEVPAQGDDEPAR
jgi:hypothetical protein